MDTKFLTELTSWLKTTDISVFVYKKDGHSVEIKTEDAPAARAKFNCNLTPVSAPAVGIFRAAAKGSSNTLKEGSAVKEGDLLGLVEMPSKKHEVRAPLSGVLRVISIEEGRPVEYGQPLFFIEA